LPFWNIPLTWSSQFIIANSLAAILISAIAGNFTHYKNGNIFPKPVLYIGLAAVVSSWFTQTYFVNTALFSPRIFLALLILLLIYVLFYTIKTSAKETDINPNQLTIPQYLTTGLLSGIVAAVSGLGGGIVVIPLLHHWLGVHIKKASAISLGVILISSFTITLTNLFAHTEVANDHVFGYIIPFVVGILSISVMLTAPWGVRMAQRVSSKTVKLCYAVILIVILANKISAFIQLLRA
jgi:uncharacterized membrane protein YfcA